jgi:hypothetical protein
MNPSMSLGIKGVKRRGSGFICKTRALPGAVIPAKAGIYSAIDWKSSADGLDSRFRGNDHCFKRGRLPNDSDRGADFIERAGKLISG